MTPKWGKWMRLFRAFFPTNARGELTVDPNISPDRLRTLLDAAPAMPKEFTLHEEIARYGEIGVYRQTGRMTDGEEFPSKFFHLYLGSIETPVTVPCDLTTGSYSVGDALWLGTLAPEKTTRAGVIAALEESQARMAQTRAGRSDQFAAGMTLQVQTLFAQQETRYQRMQAALDRLKREP